MTGKIKIPAIKNGPSVGTLLGDERIENLSKPTGIDISLAGQPTTLYENHYNWLKGSWYSHLQR